MCAGGFRVPNLQTELNYLDSFKSYSNSSDLGFLSSGVGQVGGGYLVWSTIVYMSSGMFRGKESSNRIELSQLVQDLLNFGVSGSLRPWGQGGWVDRGGEWLGGAPYTCAHACTCTHAHTRTCMHGKHDNFMQMAAPIGGIHGNSLWCHMHMCMHVCACMHVHVHVCGGHPLTTPHPIHPPPTPRGNPGISQNSKALELIEIFQFYLKIWNLWRLPHPRVGV